MSRSRPTAESIHRPPGALPANFGTFMSSVCCWNAIGVAHAAPAIREEAFMNGLIYLIGLIVVIMFILSFLGLR